MTYSKKLMFSAAALGLMTAPAMADQVILDDLIVDGSACIGQDCVNGESFGFDTIRLKENNLRIKFQDTSASASFPTTDWTIVANDSSNGGASYLAFQDNDTNNIPFLVEASAPSHALRVDDGGRVGFGVANPVVELHAADGDTPTLRLEQDGTSGFTPQTFDIATNETNFFVRDVTNGSQLPFKIIPGADSNSLVVAANNNIGMGTSNTPSAPLHVRRTGASDADIMRLENNGATVLRLVDTSSGGQEWTIQSQGGTFRMASPAVVGPEMTLDDNGNMAISGSYTSAGTTLTVPDYVFADDYDLRPLSEVRAFIDTNSHLPEVPSAAMIAEDGLNMTDMQMTLLKKVEELTLYTLAQEEELAALRSQVDALSQN